jgi:AraC-like DNA-binding protein
MEVPGSEPIVCSPGSIALIPPAVSVRVAADEEPSCDIVATEHCVVGHDGVIVCDLADGGQGDLRYVSGIVLASFSGSFGLFDRLDRPIVQQLGANETVQHAYGVMLDEMTRSSVGAKALTSALMKACLVIFIRESVAGAGPGGSLLQSLPDPRFRKAIASVLDRPADGHSVGSMAVLAGMSRSAFSRNFHAAFGMSPIAFVAKTRLHHAAQLLRSTPLPVKVIAGAAGFASRSHFSRAFKAAYGAGPNAFRESHGSGAIDPPR